MKKNKEIKSFFIGFLDGFSGAYKFASFSIETPKIDFIESNVELDWKKVGESMIYAAKKTKEKNAA